MGNNSLREVRESFLISKAKLAKMANISPLTISRIEKGYQCREVTKRKIAFALEHNFFHQWLGIDQRLGIDRRQFSYTMHVPERRTVKNRRKKVNGIKTRAAIYKMIF